jgi:hypothetical protein
MSATFDVKATPRVTVSVDTNGVYTAVVEIDGLSATRYVSFEEKSVGITALNPPTVTVDDLRKLIDGCIRATLAAVSSSLGGGLGGPGAMLMLAMRTVIGVRGALRRLDEEIDI